MRIAHPFPLSQNQPQELIVGSRTIGTAKRPGSTLWMKYEMDGKRFDRALYSPRYWHALFHFAIGQGKQLRLLELDQPVRYRELFPDTLIRRLAWFRHTRGGMRPAARLYDPRGSSVIDLLRCHSGGLSVDVLHNLAGGRPLMQTVWIADIMALRPMMGIELVRDYSFLPSPDA